MQTDPGYLMAKSTGSMNPAVKCITVTVCSGVLYCSYYVASPAINLSLLLMKAARGEYHKCLKSDLFGIVPGGKVAVLGFFFYSLPSCFARRYGSTHGAYFAPTYSELEFITHECQVLSSLSLTEMLCLKAWLVLQFGKCFTLVIFFKCLLFQVHHWKAEYLSGWKLGVPCVSQSNHEVFAQQVTSNTCMILNLRGPFETDRTTLFLRRCRGLTT